ncbi:K(+)-transporting ATPase subunit C [Enterococcus sp. BWM-S5]|uniref:Potassium-transporting ATPase KdpC subunit n=1 Tax=Enterococcus larvae TaxID=2794352 RepID=A0ABS4CJA5_9ENTE|nr:K(+)-transporting ATPase subunit C [Enterococcus larvae]MBP1046105.1 K(+)-transporting ATPase subunit C [Enterococcus larvae]
MKREILGSLRFFLLMTVICGGIYTLAVTGVAQLFFPHQANGSLMEENSKIIGSTLIGQEFTTDQYFHGRPSEVSQLSPYDPTYKELIAERTEAIRSENDSLEEVPAELVMASASGIDPHISLAGAKYQVKRIADSRNIELQRINDIIEANKEKDLLTGNEYINVLVLNTALDRLE